MVIRPGSTVPQDAVPPVPETTTAPPVPAPCMPPEPPLPHDGGEAPVPVEEAPPVQRGGSGPATAIVALLIGGVAGCGNNRPAVDAADTAGDAALGSDRAYF